MNAIHTGFYDIFFPKSCFSGLVNESKNVGKLDISTKKVVRI